MSFSAQRDLATRMFGSFLKIKVELHLAAVALDAELSDCICRVLSLCFDLGEGTCSELQGEAMWADRVAAVQR